MNLQGKIMNSPVESSDALKNNEEQLNMHQKNNHHRRLVLLEAVICSRQTGFRRSFGVGNGFNIMIMQIMTRYNSMK